MSLLLPIVNYLKLRGSLLSGDSFTFQNGAAFSTYDQDNDDTSTDHYTACHLSNLNGRYLEGSHTSYAIGVNWHTWKGFEYSFKATEMKIKKNEWTKCQLLRNLILYCVLQPLSKINVVHGYKC